MTINLDKILAAIPTMSQEQLKGLMASANRIIQANANEADVAKAKQICAAIRKPPFKWLPMPRGPKRV
jgi:hypothetical protein